jgi:hypothetical protein
MRSPFSLCVCVFSPLIFISFSMRRLVLPKTFCWQFFAFCLHFNTFCSHKSFSTSSNHPNLGPLAFLIPSVLLSVTVLATVVRTIPITQRKRSRLLLSISDSRSRALYNSFSFCLVLILHTPSSVTGPYIALKIVFFHTKWQFKVVPVLN